MLVEIENEKKIITLKDRRSHLKLSLEKRRQELARQAKNLIKHYRKTARAREDWQGGDTIET